MPNLSSKTKTAIGVIVGFLLLAIAVILILLLLNNLQTPEPAPEPEPIPEEIVEPAPSFDGTYQGNTAVAAGLADVTVSIQGLALTGTATYLGEGLGYSLSLPATISGTVSENGVVEATVIVSGNQYGIDFYFTGPANGNAADGTITCTYTVSGEYGTYGGEITLTKVVTP